MTFVLRDRADGQVEIIINRPVLVGVFPERSVAQRVCKFLQEDESFGMIDDAVAGFGTAQSDVAEAEAEVLADSLDEPGEVIGENPPPPRRPVRNLPTVVAEKPMAPVFLKPRLPAISEQALSSAFRRLAAGDRMAEVARDLGVNLSQLRGHWARSKRQSQVHMAEGGQIDCALCGKPFTPSMSSPDKCARCSHE